MSSPPGSSSLYVSSPVDLPVSGNTDSQGNLTINTIVRQAYWVTAKFVGQTSGSPRWTLFKGGSNIPLDFGQGPSVSIGPFVLGPNQPLRIQVQGALPGTAVQGVVTGIQSPDGGSAVDHFVPLSSTQYLQPVQLTVLQADGNFHSMVNIPIPAGTHSIVLTSELQNNPSLLNSLQITGHTTGVIYVGEGAPVDIGERLFGDGPTYGFLFSAYDTSLDITWQINVAGSPIYVTGDMDPTVVDITPGAFISARLESEDGGVNIDSFASGTNATGGSQNWKTGSGGSFSGYYNGLLVTEFGSKPAPWQAANQLPIGINTLVAAASNFTLIPAPGANLEIYLWTIEYHWGTIGATPNAFGDFRAGAGGSALLVWNCNSTGNVCFTVPFYGAPLGINQPLIIRNNGTAAMPANMNGTVSYSIA